jgi:hypothetical protein
MDSTTKDIDKARTAMEGASVNVICYFAASTDSECLCVCWHAHQTVREAADCNPCAGSYVVRVVNGVTSALTAEEESQFQSVMSERHAAQNFSR